jgi:hypothetical protein
MANRVDRRLKKKNRNRPSILQSKWLPWVLVALIVVAIAVPLALVLPNMLPKSKGTLQAIPQAAEQDSTQGAQKPATNALPQVSNEDRAALILAARKAKLSIGDEMLVSMSYSGDVKHVIVGIPDPRGHQFGVKTYKFTKQANGSWKKSK